METFAQRDINTLTRRCLPHTQVDNRGGQRGKNHLSLSLVFIAEQSGSYLSRLRVDMTESTLA